MHFTVSSIYFSSEGIVCVFDKNCLLVSSSYSVISMGEVFSRFTVKGAIVRLRSTLFTYETHNSMFTTASPLTMTNYMDKGATNDLHLHMAVGTNHKFWGAR